MNKRYFVRGLPASASENEIRSFFTLLGPVSILHECETHHEDGSTDWQVKMKTTSGSKTLHILNGEGYSATMGWKKHP